MNKKVKKKKSICTVKKIVFKPKFTIVFSIYELYLTRLLYSFPVAMDPCISMSSKSWYKLKSNFCVRFPRSKPAVHNRPNTVLIGGAIFSPS